MQSIIDFFDNPFFTVFGGLSTVVIIVSFLWGVSLALMGILPVWYRLGTSLSRRKVAIFADAKYSDLKAMLVDSGLFKEKNIIKVERDSLKKAEQYDFYLVHYQPFKQEMNTILDMKKDTGALLVYAPPTQNREERVSNEVVQRINSQRNSILVNMRGRLLNDVFLSMLTTGAK